MQANLTEDEARVTLEVLDHTEKHWTPDELALYRAATAKLKLSIQSKAQVWYQHLIDQGIHPNTAKQHVRHRFGEVEL